MPARQARMLALDVADLRGAAVAMLGAAATLQLVPGHHGLPCPLRTLTGIPCPLCGMTTSVEATTRLDLHSAVAANPAGIPAVLAALVLLVRPPRSLHLPSFVVPLLLAALWLWELNRFSIL